MSSTIDPQPTPDAAGPNPAPPIDDADDVADDWGSLSDDWEDPGDDGAPPNATPTPPNAQTTTPTAPPLPPPNEQFASQQQTVVPKTPNANPTPPSVFAWYVFDTHAPMPPDPAIFEGFMAASDLCIWMGREKHRKSNLLLQMAICAATRRDFLHFRFAAEAPIRVVYIDYESKADKLKRRYDNICDALKLTATERQQLDGVNLKIIRVRESYKQGKNFPRFPVATNNRGQLADPQADGFWRALVQQNPAELYIVDPMRCMHSHDENDSSIEALLARIRQFFGNATVVIAHHLRKASLSKYEAVSLKDDMRAWSDNVRGSGTLKAHADVIVCQEQKKEPTQNDDRTEIVYFGFFSKDETEVEPMALTESDPTVPTFYWEVSKEVPPYLRDSFEALRQNGGPFADKTAAVKVIQNANKAKRATAYRHVGDMLARGLLVGSNGQLVPLASAIMPGARSSGVHGSLQGPPIPQWI